MERLVREAGNTGALVHVVSGQVAREFLDRYTPAVIISDTGFPMNGVQTVQWLLAHGYEDYPLIGLSVMPISSFPPNVVAFYVSSNARYFNKVDFTSKKLAFVQQVAFNTEFNRRTYPTR